MLKQARRHHAAAKAELIKTALRAPYLAQPEALTAAYAATVGAPAAVLITLNKQIGQLEAQVETHFHQHPDAPVYLSQPGIGDVNGPRILAEFGDDPDRYASAKARKNYAGSSPITRASGRSRIVLARYVRNDRLADALHSQALSAPSGSPGARAYHDKQRARGVVLRFVTTPERAAECARQAQQHAKRLGVSLVRLNGEHATGVYATSRSGAAQGLRPW